MFDDWNQVRSITARIFYNKKFKLKGNFLNIIIRNSADLTHENNDDATALTTTIQTKQASKQAHKTPLTPAVILVVGETSLWARLDTVSSGLEESWETARAQSRAVTLLTLVLTACSQQHNYCPHSLRSAT